MAASVADDSASSAAPEALWLWKGDVGWTCYDMDISSQLEARHRQGVDGLQLVVGDWCYVINFATMTQTNATTQRRRPIRRDTVSGAVWQWEAFPGGFQRYAASLEVLLELSYNAGYLNVVSGQYEINLVALEQINRVTGFVRKVRRVVITPTGGGASSGAQGAAPVSSVPGGNPLLPLLPQGLVQLADSNALQQQPHDNSTHLIAALTRCRGRVTCEGNLIGVDKEEAVRCLVPSGPIDDACAICLDHLTHDVVKLPKCYHCYHKECIEDYIHGGTKAGFVCPLCNSIECPGYGLCPRGTMSWSAWSPSGSIHLEGYPDIPTIMISYDIPSGIQSDRHPNPSRRFSGTRRSAYLPYNKPGRLVLKMLIRAFKLGHTFTVGTSITTGAQDVTTWNGIHHKTSMTGGVACHGFPDATYLDRVMAELRTKGLEPTAEDNSDSDEDMGGNDVPAIPSQVNGISGPQTDYNANADV